MRQPAYYNHGRWVVHCPRMTCNAATLVTPGKRRVKCACRDDIVCEHGEPCGQVIDAELPRTHAAIVRTLALRKDVATRNWYPHETLRDLKAENIAHGVEAVR